MRAGEREVGEVMVKVRLVPIGGVMTRSTICAILTVMFIILLVAGIAVQRRALVLTVHMAGFASHFRVFALQLERSQVVIELCGRPSLRGVTLAAIQPKAAVMRLIVMVTGIAILWRRREIRQRACVDMTLHAG